MIIILILFYSYISSLFSQNEGPYTSVCGPLFYCIEIVKMNIKTISKNIFIFVLKEMQKFIFVDILKPKCSYSYAFCSLTVLVHNVKMKLPEEGKIKPNLVKEAKT